MTTMKQPHWAKNPLVWMIIFFPTAAVVAGFNLLYLAIVTDDGLVSGDYYKEGMGINKTITHDLIAIEKNINGLMSINASTGSIQTRFSNDIKSSLGKSLPFELVHRTIPGFDQQTTLNQVGDTLLYTGNINSLPNTGGRWRWKIQHDDWRISERFTTKKQEVIVHSFPSIPQ